MSLKAILFFTLNGKICHAICIKFRNSEKAPKFENMSRFSLKLLSKVKKSWVICFQIFVAFSEYMNSNALQSLLDKIEMVLRELLNPNVAQSYETLFSSLIIYFHTLVTCVLDKAQKKHSVPRWLQSVCEVQSLLTRLSWLIHTSVLPSNWNLGKNFALTC